MPYLVTCPKCGNQLKSAVPVPAARAVSCPLCKAVFHLDHPAPAVDLPAAPAIPRSPPPPPPRPARPHRPSDEDDDPPRRRRDEDDTAERPRHRKRPDDDVPPTRRRSGRKGLLLALGGLAALFLVCAGGGVAIWLADPFGWFDGGSADLLAWMPADTRAVEGLDPVEVGKNPHALAVLRADLKAAESVGIKAEDMIAVMQGKKTAKGEVEVTVVRLKAAPDQDRIRQAAGGTEATANGKTYYRTRAGGGLYFAPGRVVVLTRSEDAMTGLLQKEAGKVVVPDDLKAAVGRVSGHLWGAAVGSEANLFAPPPGKDAPAGVTPPPAPTVTVMTAQLAGPDEVSLKLELTYPDADTARKAADQIEGLARQNKARLADMEKLLGKGPNPAARKMQDAKKMFDTLKVAATGPAVVITATLTIESLESFGKAGGLGGL